MRNNKALLTMLSLAAAVVAGCQTVEGGGRPFGTRYNRISSYQPYKASLSVAVSPDGKHVAAALMAHADVWDTRTGLRVRRFWALNPFGITGVRFYDDQTLLTAGRDKALRFWNLRTGKETKRIAGDRCWFWPLAIAPDGRTAASLETGGRICVWDLTAGRMLREFPGPADGVEDARFLPDGNTLATSSSAGNQIVLWDVRTGEKRKTIPAETFSLAISPDGKRLAYRKDNAVTVYNLDTDTIERVLTPHEFGIGHYSFAFSPDGKTLAAAELGGDVILWNLVTGKELIEYHGPHGDGLEIVFHPDGKSVFVAGYRDTTIRQWTVPEPKESPEPSKP
ncbi:MAG: WD40 repeat domain-containing protein [Phycisphaerae bacterium]|nr:WD40 repeat domain-containing protein [Phycisphaerae bacterium]